MTYKGESTWPPKPFHTKALIESGVVSMDDLVDAVARDFAEPDPTDAEQVARWDAYKRSHPTS